MLKILTLVTAALVALTIPLIAQDGGRYCVLTEARIRSYTFAPRLGTPPLSCFPKRKTCWILWSEIPNTGT